MAEYLVDLNGKQAYLRSHPRCRSDNTAGVEACKLLKKPNIQAAVAAGKKRQLDVVEVTATRVLEELSRIAFVDPADFYDAQGNLLPIVKMSKAARAAIAGMEQARVNLLPNDAAQEWLHRVRFNNKNQALELLGKHLKLFENVLKLEGDWDKLAARLARVRTQAK